MTLTDYAIIFAIGVLSATGQYLLKGGVSAIISEPAAGLAGFLTRAVTHPSFLLAGASYVFAFTIYLLVLAKSDVSQIFPAAIGVNILCVTVMAAAMLGETVTIPRIVGMAVIVIGVYIVTRS